MFGFILLVYTLHTSGDCWVFISISDDTCQICFLAKELDAPNNVSF